MDDGKLTALTLLDVFAALDTIDHTVLLKRLDNWFGMSGEALAWFKLYLTGRSQAIKLGRLSVHKIWSHFQNPERVVPGPLLFTRHTTSLSSFTGHSTTLYFSADDSRLYVSLSSGDSTAPVNDLQSCLASVQSWMFMNKLKLNLIKTEFLLIVNER